MVFEINMKKLGEDLASKDALLKTANAQVLHECSERQAIGESLTTLQDIMKRRVSALGLELESAQETVRLLQRELAERDRKLAEKDSQVVDTEERPVELQDVQSPNIDFSMKISEWEARYTRMSEMCWGLQSTLSSIEHEKESHRQEEIHKYSEELGISGHQNSEALERIVQMSLQRGDIDSIVQGMRLHHNQDTFQEESCRALGTLANRKRNEIAALGGIHRILSAMESHQTHSGVQAAGCLALKALASTAEIRYSIAGAGGIFTLAKTIDAHRGQVVVLEQAMAALLGMCWSDYELAQRVKREVGAERISNVISQLPTGNTRFWGQQLLHKLELV